MVKILLESESIAVAILNYDVSRRNQIFFPTTDIMMMTVIVL